MAFAPIGSLKDANIYDLGAMKGKWLLGSDVL